MNPLLTLALSKLASARSREQALHAIAPFQPLSMYQRLSFKEQQELAVSMDSAGKRLPVNARDFSVAIPNAIWREPSYITNAQGWAVRDLMHSTPEQTKAIFSWLKEGREQGVELPVLAHPSWQEQLKARNPDAYELYMENFRLSGAEKSMKHGLRREFDSNRDGKLQAGEIARMRAQHHGHTM